MNTMKKTLIAAAILATGLASFSAMAEPYNYGKMIESLSKGEAKVIKDFKGPSGLTGVVIEQAGTTSVVWGINGVIFIGAAIDAKGDNITALAVDKISAPIQGKLLVAALNHEGHFVKIGKEGAPVVHMIADPACPHCHSMWKTLKPYTDKGLIQIKLYPVSGLGDEVSRVHAASVLQTGQGEALFDAVMLKSEGWEKTIPLLIKNRQALEVAFKSPVGVPLAVLPGGILVRGAPKNEAEFKAAIDQSLAPASKP